MTNKQATIKFPKELFTRAKNDDFYDDGYEDAMTERNRCRSAVETHYSLLMQKLERLAYGYGNPEPLTRDEIRKIKDLLDGLTS